MKGISKMLAEMQVGDKIVATGIARDGIYLIARRKKRRVSVERFVGGFYVTCVGIISDKPVVEPAYVPPEPVAEVDDWEGWSEERTTRDEQTDDLVTYRQHLKTGRVKEIRRETYYG